MSTMTFKPKKAQIHVPGFGLITREEFNNEHTAALFKRADKAGIKREAFIEQHLKIASYGDMPLFEEPASEEVSAEVEEVAEVQEKPKQRTRRSKKEETESV